MNTLRAWDMMNDTNAGGVLNSTNYSSGTAADGEEIMGGILVDSLTNIYRFLASIDLDRMNHNSDVIVSGMNTIGSSVNLNLLFEAGGVADPINIYSFVQYDIIYIVENGQIRVDM